MKLKKEVIEQIQQSPVLQGKIAEALGKSISTVYRLARLNHDDLTKAASLKQIQAHLNLKEDEIIETVNA